jgi:translation initiation factor IF-2
MNTENTNIAERPPIVAVMGHIDHGKSTLLAYIRHSSAPLREAGGITQHVSAYEVEHETADGIKKITFLDTPGHEAFSGIRRRGAKVADVAILVVSAEDGVKPQTIEALGSIKASATPYVVAITKTDKPEANIDRTKQSLAEHEIYVEGYGGDVPVVPVSAKTGEGVPELLSMILLLSEMESLSGDRGKEASGYILESNRDIQKGIAATCIITDGSLRKGMYVVSGQSSSPVRIMENFLGKQVPEASFSSPVRIIGWDELPEVGAPFRSFTSREETASYIATVKEHASDDHHSPVQATAFAGTSVPVIVKADAGGSLEAVIHEIAKLGSERIRARVISSGIGAISENDIRLADGSEKAVIIGFSIRVDSPAKALAERNGIEVKTFDIIYKLTDWLKEVLVERTPKTKVEEALGSAKVLKVFSKVKDKQIFGGKVIQGSIKIGAQVKVMRRGEEIAQGRVRELQEQKNRTDEVAEGKEFGALVEAKVEIAPGDHIESFIIVEK